MNRFALVQVAFNLVLLANVLYLHRRLWGVTSRETIDSTTATGAETAPRRGDPERARVRRRDRRPRGVLLTLGLGAGSAASTRDHDAPAARDAPLPAREGIEGGLSDLVAAAEREEAAAIRPVASRAAEERSRQRAAEELRANIRRLHARLGAAEDPGPAGARTHASRTETLA